MMFKLGARGLTKPFGRMPLSTLSARCAGDAETRIASEGDDLFLVTKERLPCSATTNSSTLRELQGSNSGTGPLQFGGAEIRRWCTRTRAGAGMDVRPAAPMARDLVQCPGKPSSKLPASVTSGHSTCVSVNQSMLLRSEQQQALHRPLCELQQVLRPKLQLASTCRSQISWETAPS
jgi:hypothetical protein